MRTANHSGKYSMLMGAAVAALLVLPAAGADSGWVVWPTKSYTASSLRVDDIVGNVRVNVADGPMKLDVAGSRDLVNGLTVRTENGQLHITGRDTASFNVWDWKKWFDFSNIHDDDNAKMFIKVTVPRGTEVRVEDLVGNATIGDTFGKLHLETTAGDATVGRVATARVSLAGSGKIAVADVAGELKLDIAGSGRVTAGHAGNVKADIAGSGDATIGAIGGGLSVDIAGSGDFSASRVNGPVSIGIAGSGNVRIADGVANPLHVDIMGAGDLYFGGNAVDPQISAMGSGNVRLKSYTGRMSNDGMANVIVGNSPAPAHHGDDDDN